MPEQVKSIVYGNVAENIKGELAGVMSSFLKRFLEDFWANVEYVERVMARFLDLIRDISSKAFVHPTLCSS